MYKYLKHILIYSLILIYSCADKVHEGKGLALTTNSQQTYKTKNFNTIIHRFNKYAELAREAIKKHKSGKDIRKDFDEIQTYVENYDKLISWIEKNPDKKKELDKDWTEAYNWLEKRRSKNASEKTLIKYISDGIDCGINLSCQDTKKQYGTKENQIDLFFVQNLRDIFLAHSDPEEIFITFKTLDISGLKDKF
ncbi:Mlp family lipoprotein [Borrelia duttonii]|uniref:Family 113-like protein, lipoprotein n=1 Tax=Borrelia duttonii (strain Ly) TaxID=412419 RepID=B5RP38_BORDL|nr:family 113-like protein, lipoprotein [Borrelia duttonii Ly]